MNTLKGIFWAMVLGIMLWVVILSCSYSIIAEVDYRRELVKHKAQYMQWWHERDLNKHLTQKEAITTSRRDGRVD